MLEPGFKNKLVHSAYWLSSIGTQIRS